MMHRSQGVTDAWETLCSTDSLSLKRMKMKTTHEIGELATGGDEALIICMDGNLQVWLKPSGVSVELHKKDICYVPREERISISMVGGSAEAIYASAPAQAKFDPFVKRFSETPPISSGTAPYFRRIYNMVTEKDRANRFLGGFVEGDSGNWTSFPPHRHDGKSEIYVYFDMGEKFGVQMVLTEEGDKSFVVRDGDAVLFEKGYHPNVAAPGTGMNFLWVISAPPDRRDLSVEFHPAFEGIQSGATHLKTSTGRG